MKKILILGGTREASELASRLVDENHAVTTSLAGRTREPKPIDGDVRIGGFGGAERLANYLSENQFDLLIDATHPFAKQISRNAIEAAKLAKVKLEIHTRPVWKKEKGDIWIEAASLTEARDKIPHGARVLLALGSQHINIFKARGDVDFIVRMVDPPDEPLPLQKYQLLIGKPSVDWREEEKLLLTHEISHIVCRNSGGIGAYAKIEAARNLQLTVILISR